VATERLLMGLRLREGIAIDGVREQVDWAAAGRLERQGLLERTADTLRVRPRGMLLLDAILAEIVR
jgi:coproporphyrinogen III oxidase-like Fe-S oxidoreductase